jgi:ribosomal protein S8
MSQDIISDGLNRIMNAKLAGHSNVTLKNHSKFLQSILAIGKLKGYITEYGENLGNILKKNKPAVIKNEIEVITKALESSNQSKIEELKTIANVYNNIANDLLKMKVPKTFVRAHLDLINGSNGMGLALYNMQQVFQDPIKSLPAFQAYNFNASIFKNSLKATNTFIMQNKVVYKQGAGGYYLLYGL